MGDLGILRGLKYNIYGTNERLYIFHKTRFLQDYNLIFIHFDKISRILII